MPFYSRKARQRSVRTALRRKGRTGARRKVYRKALNQSQVFTETVKFGSPGLQPDGTLQVAGGTNFTAGKLQFQMNYLDFTTLNAYSALQQMQKILKVTAIIVPKWTSMDPNVAEMATLATAGVVEAPRITYAINDSTNDLLPPTNELDVLQDNGAKIRKLTKPLKIKFKPRAALDAINPTNPTHNVAYQFNMQPWIGFDGDGVLIPHVGVDWVVTQGNTIVAPNFSNVADVYYKVTFVCKDPR